MKQLKPINHKPAIIAASIILLVALLSWLNYRGEYFQSANARLAIRFLFPHEVLTSLRFLILPPTKPDAWHHMPLLSILLALFSLYGIYRYRKYGSKILLQVCCAILIVSILIDIPPIINYYVKSVKEYRNYVPPVNHEGINSLINEFSAPRKPSLALFISGLIILGLYVYGAARLLIRLEKNKGSHQK